MRFICKKYETHFDNIYFRCNFWYRFLALYHPEFFYSFIKERYEIYLHGNISLGEKARYTYFIKCNSILKTMTHKTIIILIKTLSAIARS